MVNFSISSFLDSIVTSITSFINSIDFSQHPYYLFDVIIVAVAFYYIYVLLRGTRAIPIVTGLVIVAIMSLVSQWLKLSALTWLLTHFLTFIAIAIPVVFHDEIRRGLETLGQTRVFKEKLEIRGVRKIVRALVEACEVLSTNKIGALMVIKREINLGEVLETGVPLNAEISTELLLNIFYPGAPLHDGAVIIEGSVIRAASCVLPLSLKTRQVSLGTRHKAALGISEHTDAIAIVISEEKGKISLAENGELSHALTATELEKQLTTILSPHHERKRLLPLLRRLTGSSTHSKPDTTE